MMSPTWRHRRTEAPDAPVDCSTYERRQGESLEEHQARLMRDLLEAREALDRAIDRLPWSPC